MDERIVEFCGLLRQNGIRVSVAETVDAVRALAVVGIDDQSTVRAALRTTSVKRAIDVPAFDRLFDLFFRSAGEAIQESTAATQRSLELDDAAFQRLLDDLERFLAEEGITPSELASALLRADTGRLERLLREAAQRSNLSEIAHGFQEGRFAHGMAAALGLGSLAAELDAMRMALGRADDETARRLGALIDRRQQDLQDLLKTMVRRELDQRDLERRDRQGMQALAEKSFFYLTEDEIRRMQDAVTKLARRLRNIVAIRRKRARRGRFDSRRTFRANLQFGGVPFRMFFHRKRKEKPRVVVLCDVSDSVRNVSRFMLQFVYALQDLYSKVRSFIFVADIGEVTELFTEHDANTALDTALTGNIINVYAHSDFGRAFRSFHREQLSIVNGRTTVIILGDARNNYNLAHEWALKNIHARAKQVIWLNPENRMTWGFGDSEMDRYAPYCSVVEECRNLNQLYRIVDRLVVS